MVKTHNFNPKDVTCTSLVNVKKNINSGSSVEIFSTPAKTLIWHLIGYVYTQQDGE